MSEKLKIGENGKEGKCRVPTMKGGRGSGQMMSPTQFPCIFLSRDRTGLKNQNSVNFQSFFKCFDLVTLKFACFFHFIQGGNHVCFAFITHTILFIIVHSVICFMHLYNYMYRSSSFDLGFAFRIMPFGLQLILRRTPSNLFISCHNSS